ncbi:MAG TPA: hypothetical protein VF407_14405, partial [Polyangiaceae bacterium]
EIVRLDLASGESNRVPLPGGKPVLVDVDTTGSWTMVSMVRNDDTNWYGPPDALACAQPDPFVLNFVQHGFPVWVDLESGREIGDKQIVRVAGGHVYRVEKDVLTIDDIPAGPKDCTGDLVLVSDLVSEEGLLVLGVVESPPRALVLCRRKNGPKTVMMVGPDKVLGSTKASLMGGGVNNVAPMILPKDGRTCEHFNSIDPTCLDVTTGAKSKGPLTEPVHVPGAQAGTRRFAETDDGWTLASDDDGSIEHIGPLRWIAPAK